MKTTDDLIDMNEAISILRTSRPTFYRWLRAGKIKGMKMGRQWRFTRRDIERFLEGGEPEIALSANISPLIDTLCDQILATGRKGDDFREMDSSAQTATTLMIILAVESRASDIHLTQHLAKVSGKAEGLLRVRIDGVLKTVAMIDIRLMPALVRQWKSMANCLVNEHRLPQDGRIMLNLSRGGQADSQPLDLRVNFIADQLGETVTARILDRSRAALNLDELPYSDETRTAIKRALALPNGMIICTGPTGSGKTTTLYACLNHLASPQIKVITVEDPVEYLLPWATQIPVRHREGVTFPAMTRACLRADPDVVMVGELRDEETVQVCAQVALTGHLLLTTLHAGNAVSALVRLRDIGLDPFLITECTRLVLAQRLVRKLCPQCSRAKQPGAVQLEDLVNLATAGGLVWDELPKPGFREPQGCSDCAHLGYRGRSVLCEVLEPSAALGKALREGASEEALRQIALADGMVTLQAAAIRLAASGATSIDEALRATRLT